MCSCTLCCMLSCTLGCMLCCVLCCMLGCMLGCMLRRVWHDVQLLLSGMAFEVMHAHSAALTVIRGVA